jgi:hypothetical protein
MIATRTDLLMLAAALVLLVTTGVALAYTAYLSTLL